MITHCPVCGCALPVDSFSPPTFAGRLVGRSSPAAMCAACEARYEECQHHNFWHDESRHDESQYDESQYDESQYEESRHDESRQHSLPPTRVERTPSSLQSTPSAGENSGPNPSVQPQIGERLPSLSDNRYQTIAHHANGGLGVVSIAHDLELRRRVALKQINPRYADDQELRARFIAEAEITGQLEHPGIVPVYGLGANSNGRPFYAMRFIDGESMKQAVDGHFAQAGQQHGPRGDSQNISYRRLIQSLISVCQTIEYAHSRGVIHRDLKPANIMLGRFGETFVVDWGLARPLGEHESTQETDRNTLSLSATTEQTQPGTARGTPAYMSPEQARGDSMLVGVLSDVYSLGATLYYLLTGQRPFQGDSFHAILQRVNAGDFPAPEQLNPAVPRALSAICCKAMSLEPGARYASARLLATDLEAWLADERVTATPPTMRDRIRRRVQRHPRLSASIATAIVVAVLGLSAFTQILSHKNKALSAQANALTAANASESTARQAAANQQQVALDQSRLAFDTLTVVLDDIEARLRPLPQTGTLRMQILTHILPALQQLSADLTDRSLVDHRTIQSLLALGDVTIRFAPADRFAEPTALREGSQQSALQTAHAFYGLALDTAQSQAQHSNSMVAVRDLAVAARGYAESSRRLGQTQTALRHYRWCQQLAEQLLQRDPDTSGPLLLSSAVLNDMGELHYTQGNLLLAKNDLDASVACARRAEEFGRQTEFLDCLAWALEERGDFLDLTGQPAQALLSFDEALTLRRELQSHNTESLKARQLVARTQNDRGRVLRKLGRMNEAETAVRDSLQMWNVIRADDPANCFHAINLGQTMRNLSRLLDDRGDHQQAQRLADEAIAIQRQLLSDYPDTLAYQRALGISLEEAGQQRTQVRRFDEARERYEEAITLLSHAAKHDTHNLKAQQDLAAAQQSLAKLLMLTNKLPEAITIYEQCIETTRCACQKKGDPASWSRLASQLQGLATAYSRTDRPQDAWRLFTEAIQLREAAVDSADTDAGPLPRYSLAITRERYAGALERHQQLPQALQQFHAAAAAHRQLLLEAPDRTQYRRALMVTLGSVARVQEALGSIPELLETRLECESLAAHMVALRPEEYQPVEDHSIACRLLGEAYQDLGQLRESSRWLDLSVSRIRPLVLSGNSSYAARKTLACAFEKRAGVESQQKHHLQAISSYRQALALRSHLRDQQPDSGANRQQIAGVQYRVGLLYRTTDDYEQAAHYLRNAVLTIEGLLEEGRETDSLRLVWRKLSAAAARAERDAVAIGDLDALLSADGRTDLLLEKRALHFMKTAQWKAAVEAALLIPGTRTQEPRPLYNAACVISRAAEHLSDETRRELRLCACDMLLAARQTGFTDLPLLWTDEDLNGVRHLAGFQQLFEAP